MIFSRLGYPQFMTLYPSPLNERAIFFIELELRMKPWRQYTDSLA